VLTVPVYGPQGEVLFADSREFNPDQPRDPNGEWTSGGISVPTQKDKEFIGAEMNDHEATSVVIRNRAREMNFPIKKVETRPGAGKEFKVGEHNYQEAGHAEIYTTGNIVLYTGAVNMFNAGGIVAHEVEHVRFEGVLNNYHDDVNRLNYWSSHENYHSEFDRVTDGAGWLDASKGSAVDFPVATVLQPYLDKNVDQLAKEDGVSAYSRAYWESARTPEAAAKFGGYVQARERAIHETLSEMARIKYQSSTKGSNERPEPGDLKPTPMWNSLFKEVNSLAKDGGYGYS
jgi:hypothetical protein